MCIVKTALRFRNKETCLVVPREVKAVIVDKGRFGVASCRATVCLIGAMGAFWAQRVLQLHIERTSDRYIPDLRSLCETAVIVAEKDRPAIVVMVA